MNNFTEEKKLTENQENTLVRKDHDGVLMIKKNNVYP